MTDGISREEFAMLRDQVTENQRRLDAIDASGTRGVGVIAVQVAEVIKDVADLRQDMRDHQRGHEKENQSRSSARRWAWGFGLAALAAIESPLFWLLAHTH
jgi:hypothetical protein